MASRLLGGYFVGGEMTVNRAACFVFNDYHRTSSVTNMTSKLGWQDLETRGRISDLIIVFKIQTGHVKIPFPNDLLETASPCVTRASTQHPFQYQRFLSNNNMHKFSFLLELSQFGISYPRLLYTLTMLMPFTRVFVVNYLFNSRYFCNVIRF